MATTRLKLYNGAARLIGDTRLDTLDDDVELRHILDDAWDDDFIRKVLEQGFWRFAMRAQELTFDTSTTPPFGYKRAFLKSSDWVRTAAISNDEFFTSPLLHYQDEVDFIFTDLDVIWVRFVSDDGSFGGDLSKWPGTFQDFGEAYLASKITHVRTSDKERVALLLKPRTGILDRALKDARSKDAMKGPVKFFPVGSWIQSRNRRGGGGPFGDGGVSGSLIG